LSRNKILHFHIPKTAGTALREFFCAQLGAERVSPGLVGLRLEEGLLRWSKADVISGHFNVYQGDKLPSDRINVTCVRDPRDRFLSEFYFLKHDNEARLLDAQLRRMELADYIRHCESSANPAALVQIDMLSRLGIGFEEQLTVENRLAAAQRALDHFDLVGVQEELDDFSCMIAAHMDWPRRELPRANITQNRRSIEELDPSERRSLDRLLLAEIDLYHHAHARFRQDRRRYIRPFELNEKAAEPPNTPATDQPSQPRNFGDLRCELLTAAVCGDISGPTTVMCGERANIDLRFAVREPIEQLNIGFAIKDEAGALMFGTNSLLLGNIYALPRGDYTARFSFFNRLGLGSYKVDCSLIRTNSHHDGCYHWVEQAAEFVVYDSMLHTSEGRVLLDADVQVTADGQVRSAVEPIKSELELRTFGGSNRVLEDFSAQIEPLARIERFACGADVSVPLNLRNSGNEIWRAGGRNQVTLSYRWYTAEGALVVGDGLRTLLPGDLAAGESVILPMLLRVPESAGNYRLLISPVQELVAWFFDRNPQSVMICNVEIR